MPDFTTSVNPTPINGLLPFYQSQAASNAGIAAQQDLTDRATLRAQAPGFASTDPDQQRSAIGTALSVPGVGGANAAGGVDAMNTDQRSALDHRLSVAGGLAQAILLAPADQREATYQGFLPILRQAGAAPPDQYPGDARIGAIRDAAFDANKRLEWLSKVNAYGTGGAPQDPFGARGGPAPGAPAGGAPAANAGQFQPGGTPFVPKNLPAGITPDEDAMTRTVIGEAGNQGALGQQAVAHVVVNRASGAGVSPQSIVFAPGQFEPWGNPTTRAGLEALDPSSPEYQAALKNVRAVTSGGAADPTGGATHFYAPAAQAQLGRQPPAWTQGQQPTVIGGHNFYRLGYGPAGGAQPAAGQADSGPGYPPGAPMATPTAVPDGMPGPPPIPPIPPEGGAPFDARIDAIQGALVDTTPLGRIYYRPAAPGTPDEDGTVHYPSADAATAALGQGYPPAPPIPNQNALLSVGAPGGTVPAAPLNQLMPAASATPPPSAAPASPAPASPATASPAATSPLAGASAAPGGPMLLRNAMTGLPVEHPIAGKGFGIGPSGVPVRIGPPNIQYEKTNDQIVGIDKDTNKVVSRESITDSGRMIKVPGPNGETEIWQSGRLISTIPANARINLKEAYAADLPRAQEITASGQTSQNNMLRLNEMASLIPQLATGPTAELRAKGAAFLEGIGASPETIKSWTGMASGSLAQELPKLALATAGAAAKTDVGSNNGIQSTQLYVNANPGMALLPDANKRMTNMIRIASQQSQDYTTGALQHFGTNERTFLHGGDYDPLTTYNRQWLAQHNPQVGAAAMGMLNGDSFERWSARIDPKDAVRAAGIVARIDPNAVISMKGGGQRPVSAVLAHPAASAP